MSAADAIEANIVACYPERGIAGFSRVDSTFLFYSYVNALVSSTSVVLDLGAGRGAQVETTTPGFKRSLLTLKGRVARLIGADVDPAVLENPLLDEAHVIAPGEALPFDDASFDLILSDWVAEHVDDPTSFAAEIHRILKPGGWFCARTPNKFGVIAAGATLIPNRLHRRVLNLLQPNRKEHDVFPTRYRLNTRAAVRKHFARSQWRDHSFLHATEIMYLARSRTLFALSAALTKITPNPFLPVLYIFVQKTSPR